MIINYRLLPGCTVHTFAERRRHLLWEIHIIGEAVFAGLEVFFDEFFAGFFLFCFGSAFGQIRFYVEKDLIAVFFVHFLGRVHWHGAPGLPAGFDKVGKLHFQAAAAVQVSNQSFGLDVVCQLSHVGNDHLFAHCRGEERRSLGTPVIVYGKSGDTVSVSLCAAVNKSALQFCCLSKQFF